ncbi:MAG: AGE family epimerase/isomerase [Chloroflexi bacterium]|nr:AGE family epimerase/isomerase [Chloroflexota bacterium]
MMTTADQFGRYRSVIQQELLENVAPFWLEHSLDREYGGYLHCLERDGAVFDTDKFLWMQGRELWTWAALYNDVEPKAEFLEAARLGADFLRLHAWDADGRVPFAVERDGAPLLKPRDIYAESFLAVGMSAYARATGEAWAQEMAQRAYDLYVRLAERPETHDASAYPGVRPALVHGISFIALSMSQELRRNAADERYEPVIDQALTTIMTKHVHAQRRALFEYVAPTGGALPGPMGRLLIPGHAVESMGFVLQEAARRGDRALTEAASDVILWSLEAGWDAEYGGILYFIDAERAQNRKLEWDMKLWWVHVEAMVGALRAYALTRREAFWEWFERIFAWSWSHFRDPRHGEWFGYLHRDGSLALSLKGSMWKGCFHLPRALMQIEAILSELP